MGGSGFVTRSAHPYKGEGCQLGYNASGNFFKHLCSCNPFLKSSIMSDGIHIF